MSLEDKIREKFKSSKVIREAKSKWSPDTQPNLYELDSFLRKSGYRLVDFIDGELFIEPIKEGHLHPEIMHDDVEGHFYAKIVDYGMLIASDVEEIIKGYTTALGVLNHLEALDLSKLEIEDEE